MKFKFVLLLIIFSTLFGCTTIRSTSDYDKRRSLMILDGKEQPKNKKYYSKHNIRTKKKSLKKQKKQIKEIRKNRKK